MTETGNAIILSDDEAGHAELLWQLRARPDIEFIDNLAGQRAALLKLTPEPTEDILAESPPHWIYFPWRRSVLAMLGPRAFRRLRLDRNRNLITLDEQNRLGELRIGIVGLSVGHVIAHTLAAQASAANCGSPISTIWSSAISIGCPPRCSTKATTRRSSPRAGSPNWTRTCRARRNLRAHPPETIDAFLDGLDIVVEVCDSLDTKVLLREAARARRIPVLMATSDRGLVDVERFDLDPARPILHGLLGDVQTAGLAGLTSADKVPPCARHPRCRPIVRADGGVVVRGGRDPVDLAATGR